MIYIFVKTVSTNRKHIAKSVESPNCFLMLAVTILGNNSAVPAFDRHPTSQVVTIDGTLLPR